MSSRHPWNVSDSFARPANTTQYTAADAVSDSSTPTALEFQLPSPGKSAVVRSASLHKDDQDLTGAAFDLLLFSESPAAAGFDDNNALAITDAEFANFLGFVEFAQADGRSVVTGDVWTKTNLDMPVIGDSEGKIYGILVARDTYTPASEETFTVVLGGTT